MSQLTTIDMELLEQELQLRIQNIKNGLANLRILDYYPELRGPIFNRKNISEEIGFNNRRALAIIREIKRREIQ